MTTSPTAAASQSPRLPAGRRSRVVITLGPGDPATDLYLEAIARLAGRSHRQLVANYMDSTPLLAAAMLPFTRTVGRFGEISALDPGTTSRAVNATRLRWRQRIERLATMHNIELTFEEPHQQPAEEFGDDDIVCGTASCTSDWRAYRGNAIAALVQPGGHGILLAYSGNRRSLDVAADLALDLRLPVEIVLMDTDDDRVADSRNDIDSWRRSQADAGKIRFNLRTAPASLAGLIRQQRPRIVIVDRLALITAVADAG